MPKGTENHREILFSRGSGFKNGSKVFKEGEILSIKKENIHTFNKTNRA